MTNFEAEVSRIRDLTHDVRELGLRLLDPPEIEFVPGQFISFQIEAPGARFPFTRVYSIASPPSVRTSIDLLFNLVPDGPGSSFLYAQTPGSRVRFSGPAGTFVLHHYATRDVLFVATGTGIAPFRSMIPSQLAAVHDRRVTLVWGLRSERDLYYQDDFLELAERHPNFSFVTTLSQPSAGWTGATGRVQQVVAAQVDSVDELAVYVCGNSGMIKSVVDLIRSKGVCPIHREQYYRDPDGAVTA